MTDFDPNFRALCTELAVDLEEWIVATDHRPASSVKLVDRARTALATPPPEPPTDEELYDYWISTSPQFGCADPVGFARAVLERWGK
jgi:hypothetical protein